MTLRLGIDTGGTFTDAVLIDGQGTIIHSAKALTTHRNLVSGIDAAIAGLPGDVLFDVSLVGLSTTLATNAIVEGRAGRATIVFVGFERTVLDRAGLRQALGQDSCIFLSGGHNSAGMEVAPLDLGALEEAMSDLASGQSGVAVIGAFAVRNPAHELAVADLIRTRTGLAVTCSHELTSKLDGPKRALTTLFNARLIGRIADLLKAVETSLNTHKIDAPLMVVRGDGALFSVRSATSRPIETILSGPAASCVGAAWLSGLDNALVSDIGGTTTDIGMIAEGRPARSPSGAVVGGHRTMVEAVDVQTTGLGGDSHITSIEGQFRIGPERALPLGRLAIDHPAIIEQLNEQMERPEARPHDGVLAILHTIPQTRPGLTSSQRRLIEMLDDGPKSVEAIIDRERLGMAFDELVARGWVLRAAVTPSDAAQVCGKLDLLDGQASAMGLALLKRQHLRVRGASLDGIDQFAATLVDRFEQKTAATVMHFGLRQSGFGDDLLNTAGASALIDAAAGGFGDHAVTRLNPALSPSMIAVGAPAALFYPGVAQRLDANLHLPGHFEICNAVGAVVGIVTVAREVHIAAHDEHYAVLLESGPKSAANLEDALALATADARSRTNAAISSENAEDVSEHVHTDIRDYTDVTGQRKVIEAVVRVEAVGRPAFASAR